MYAKLAYKAPTNQSAVIFLSGYTLIWVLTKNRAWWSGDGIWTGTFAGD
jgi:hypothetical protein